MENLTNNDINKNHCGIKKIIDCKINENGQQMYKVKWECTWEPAENLVTCQYLVDEFWSYVNILKSKEESSLLSRKRIKLDPDIGNVDFPLFSVDNKTDVQQLITRTNSTSSDSFLSPRMLMSTQTIQSNQIKSENTNLNRSSNDKNGKLPHIDNKTSINSKSLSSNTISTSSLKYLENFDNPFVKIVLLCKLCNKEQSLKHVGNWKLHYLTHSAEKPFKCHICPKSYVRGDYLRNHIEKNHVNSTQLVASKQEQF